MQKPERKKKYKDSEPEKTVETIRGLLTRFGIEINEKVHHIPTADIHSCRIWIANAGLEEMYIGTNGKGMDLAYTRASAYGEFMERLENNLLLPGDDTNTEGLVDLDKEEAAPLIEAFCREVFGDGETVSGRYLNETALDKIRFQTFHDVLGGTDVLLPYALLRFMTGSNGMCAGNSRDEAILQGISEIFERHVHYELVLNNVVPPEIDKELFEGTDIYDRLEELTGAGYRCRILDLSLGRGFPVVGLIVYHGEGYRAWLGADPSPITALERCFTEIFQGCDRIDDSLFFNADEQRADRDAFAGTDREYWFEQYKRGIIDGSGYFPPDLISETDTPDYEFTGFAHPVTASNGDDLDYYMDILRHEHKKLYISDRSALGFPAYFVYIPSFSETTVKDDGGSYLGDRLVCAMKRSGLKRVYSMDKQELLTLADAVEKWFGIYATAHSCINYLYDYCDFEPFHQYKVLAYLYACGGEREKAEGYLDAYFDTCAGEEDDQSLVWKLVSAPSVEQCFPRDSWPVCPDCDACGMKAACRLEEIKRLNERIRDAANGCDRRGGACSSRDLVPCLREDTRPSPTRSQ